MKTLIHEVVCLILGFAVLIALAGCILGLTTLAVFWLLEHFGLAGFAGAYLALLVGTVVTGKELS